MKNRSEFVPRLAGLVLGAALILFALQIMTVEAVFSFEVTAEALMYAGVGASLVGVGLGGTLSRRLSILGGISYCIACPILGIYALVTEPDTGGDDFMGIVLILLGVLFAAEWKWRE
jgi:hypothetical protein